MSEKMTCPGCHSHLSSIHHAVMAGNPCPNCGLPAETILEVDLVHRKRADEGLKQQVEDLLVANGRLGQRILVLERFERDVRQALVEVVG